LTTVKTPYSTPAGPPATTVTPPRRPIRNSSSPPGSAPSSTLRAPSGRLSQVASTRSAPSARLPPNPAQARPTSSRTVSTSGPSPATRTLRDPIARNASGGSHAEWISVMRPNLPRKHDKRCPLSAESWPHHQPPHPAAADQEPGRPGRRGHRRHLGLQRPPLLRPGEDGGEPARLRPGARAAPARRHGGRAHPRLPALGG